MPCYSPLKGYKDPDSGGLIFKRTSRTTQTLEVACGQCLGCRLDYSRMWAMRIAHEAALWEYHGGNCFVTLTYRDRMACTIEQLEDGLHVPDDWSLNKEHMRNFFKKLRRFFPDQKVRYFYAGEYGRKCKHGIDLELVKCPLCSVGRPHYHVCLFNCSFPDLEAYQSDNGIMRYTVLVLRNYGDLDLLTLDN